MELDEGEGEGGDYQLEGDEGEGQGVGLSLWLVLHLGVTEDFDAVQKSVTIVQHARDACELLLLCDLQRSLSGLGYEGAVCSGDE